MRRRGQRGFVLVLTLWILAAIMIAASYFADRVQKSLQLAQMRQGLNDKQIDLSNMRAEILFRVSTNYLSQYGMGPQGEAIALDDRPYRGEASTVQLLDARGLLNLQFASDEQLFRFLGAMNVPADQRAHLIDTLRDYMDQDDLRRLNGAEAKEYAEKGLPPPRNGPLISPMELKNVIGWSDMKALWEPIPVTELTTTGAVTAINPNTASAQVLMALPGITPEIAQAIIARRKLEPVTVPLVSQMAGVELQQLPPQVIAYPSESIRVTQRANGLPWSIRYNIQLTPLSTISPWQITYFYRLEEKADSVRGANPSNPANIPKLPPRSALPATPTDVLSF